MDRKVTEYVCANVAYAITLFIDRIAIHTLCIIFILLSWSITFPTFPIITSRAINKSYNLLHPNDSNVILFGYFKKDV